MRKRLFLQIRWVYTALALGLLVLGCALGLFAPEFFLSHIELIVAVGVLALFLMRLLWGSDLFPWP